MKKIKTIKAVMFSAVLMLNVLTSAKIIKGYYKELRVDFFSHTQGHTNDFLNSFIY
jgi:hypothetical protein